MLFHQRTPGGDSMARIKKYALELCFLLSFVLPFIQHVSIHNGVKQVEVFTGIHFILNYFYVLLPAIACYVLYLKSKKAYLRYVVVVLYFAFIVLGITSGEIVRVAPVDYYRWFAALLPKITLFGLPINIVLGTAVILKLFRLGGQVEKSPIKCW